MTNDVAIIGVGIHPFGRFDKSAVEMGADAIRFALADAGIEWGDVQFGFGGSYEVSNPDSVTRLVGLTGITFTNVFNACATSASAIQQTADTIRLGKYDIGIAVGLDKHPRGAFTDDPAKLALPQWYAENGQFVTTKFFGMKANHYLHRHGISEETLAKVAAKNFRNGALNPNAFRRKPITVVEIPCACHWIAPKLVSTPWLPMISEAATIAKINPRSPTRSRQRPATASSTA